MTQKIVKWNEAGKGSRDRGSSTQRADCPLWKQVKLSSGINLTPEEAAEAMKEARDFMERFMQEEAAEQWLDQYFPE